MAGNNREYLSEIQANLSDLSKPTKKSLAFLHSVEKRLSTSRRRIHRELLVSIEKLERSNREILRELEKARKTIRQANSKPTPSSCKPGKKPIKASQHPAFGMWNHINDEDVPGLVREMRKGRFNAL